MHQSSIHDTVPCCVCGNPVCYCDLTKYQKQRYRETGRGYCSEDCKRVFLRKIHSETMTKTNKKYASEMSDRMKRNNPMSNPQCREKVSKTLKQMGYGPSVRGGNGSKPPEPQLLLAEALSVFNPVMEYAVPTKRGRGHGYPPCYKIDIGFPQYKLAVEVDGQSHKCIERRKQDEKKQKLLESFGWTVIRFSNEEVKRNLNGCARTAILEILRLENSICFSSSSDPFPALYKP